MNDEIGKSFIEAWKKKLQSRSGQPLVFFVVGRAGWGKSSTVNSLVGKIVSKVDDDELATTEVTDFYFTINGVKAKIFDTPGLCDGTGNESIYMREIRSKISKPDVMLYVTRLDETRITDNDLRGIKILSEALSIKIWENAVIVFTFANNVSAENYSTKLKKRTEVIKKAITDCIKDEQIVLDIPVIAIDNKNKITPDGKEWLGEFFTVVAERTSLESFITFLEMLTSSITQRTNLSKSQKEKIRKKFISAVFQNAAAGMGIGVLIAGLLVSPSIIGFAGGGILGTLIGAWLSKDE